jgi:hypothetical protein
MPVLGGTMTKAIDFLPYADYLAGVGEVDDFYRLCLASFGLTAHLLTDQEGMPRVKISTENEKPSYSMGDIEALREGTELLCGWVSTEEFSHREQMTVADVMVGAERGELGPTINHPETGEVLIAWPRELHSRPANELPPFGKNTYRVLVQLRAGYKKTINTSTVNADDATAEFLEVARTVGDTETAVKTALATMHRSCLVLQWTHFENFLRSTVIELLRLFPQKLLSLKRRTLSYDELLTFSKDLSSIESLSLGLLEREADLLAAGGLGAHGLINFNKSQLPSSRDPYSAWYVHSGIRRKGSYQQLMDIKEERNRIVHEWPAASSSGDGGRTYDHYEEAKLFLRSMAFSIAEDASRLAEQAAK